MWKLIEPSSINNERDAVWSANIDRTGPKIEGLEHLPNLSLAPAQQALREAQLCCQHGVMAVVPAVGAVAHIHHEMRGAAQGAQAASFEQLFAERGIFAELCSV